MGGSQVFYMGDNGEVLTWDGRLPDPIKPGVQFCATIADEPDGTNCPSGHIGPPGHTGAYGPPGVTGPVGEFDDPGPTGDPSVGAIDYDIGYAQALRDVLIEITASGKQNLVQWLEARLKDLP